MLDWRITSGILVVLIIIFAIIWSGVRVDWEDEFRSLYLSVSDDTPIIEDVFDVYIDRDRNSLIYVKEDCTYDDINPGFFLHLIPADPLDLPRHRQLFGFDNLDYDFNAEGLQFGNKCVSEVDLPGYSITRVRTGQYVPDGDQFVNLWQQEASLGLE